MAYPIALSRVLLDVDPMAECLEKVVDVPVAW
jgi:hypothetical protein